MIQRVFQFDEATPLQTFIDQHRDRIVGHTLKACYACPSGGTMFDERYGIEGLVFFVLDDICIGIDYLFLSHATIFTVDETDIKRLAENDNPRGGIYVFHSRIPNQDDEILVLNEEISTMNQKIIDIDIEKFSHGYDDNINSKRPDGGDYFSRIKLTLEDGSIINIEPMDAIMDGWLKLWVTDRPKQHQG